MSCEVANASPFGDPNEWGKVESPGGGLDAIVNFNASFLRQDGNTVDPQLFSNSPAPNEYHHSTYNVPSNGLDQTLSAEPSPFGDYPADFNQAPSSPYFPSIEHPPQQIYHPSPLRNNAFRRSVSEPPGGPDLQQPGPPPMMFHREHHYLGKPMPRQAVQLKSLPKAKQQRPHPYQRAHTRRVNVPEPGPPFRPEHRRAHTSGGRTGPTSSPMMMMMQMPHQQQYMPHAPMMQEPQQQFVSSRVCTPVPEMPQIDPALSGSSTPMPAYMHSSPRNAVSIPLTVDELRSMIFEAVQKAVGEKEKKDSVAGVSPRNMAATVEDREEAEAAKTEDA
ncbi:hypothetical protein CLAFUW4_02516 [Fulvia fulva]|nr:hypothetical protein CLAFUR4_02511 [Fulvia fulva]KAK4633469.1 hypothetical protein CLAFUR0_02515 [Fulvia fulva]WPV11759.1 hypothetical protein CLAFUW4_02516 [Fulvia fulva]WPV25953.1 hypothetical protein CLAFUW7_02516 [Fulvia fulva]